MIILGTGSLLPPLETTAGKVGGREQAAQARLEERMVKQEPTLDDTRALLEANLFHHELITDEELNLRHQSSIGRPFEYFAARHAAAQQKGEKAAKETMPLWQRLVELKMPLLLIYGRNDRARAEERATLLHQRYPQLDLHFADGCKHLVPWDAARPVSPAGGAVPDALTLSAAITRKTGFRPRRRRACVRAARPVGAQSGRSVMFAEPPRLRSRPEIP